MSSKAMSVVSQPSHRRERACRCPTGMRFRNSAVTFVCTEVISRKRLEWRGFSRYRRPDLRHSHDPFSLNRIFHGEQECIQHLLQSHQSKPSCSIAGPGNQLSELVDGPQYIGPSMSRAMDILRPHVGGLDDSDTHCLQSSVYGTNSR